MNTYTRMQIREFFRETLPQRIAWLLPRRVVMWAAIRLMAHATQGPYSNQVVPELTAIEALQRW